MTVDQKNLKQGQKRPLDLLPFSLSTCKMHFGIFISLKEAIGGGTSSPSTLIPVSCLTSSCLSAGKLIIQRGTVQFVLIGSMYWMPLANSVKLSKAFVSATLCKIFSSSLSCFSRSDSFMAVAFFFNSLCWSSRLRWDLGPANNIAAAAAVALDCSSAPLLPLCVLLAFESREFVSSCAIEEGKWWAVGKFLNFSCFQINL